MNFPDDFTPPENVEIIDNNSVVSWYHEGIFYILHHDSGMEHTLEDAVRQVQIIEERMQGKKVDLLLDIRIAPPLSPETRSFYGKTESVKMLSSISVMVKSPLSRMIGNFYLSTFKASLKTKMFTRVEDAVKSIKKRKS